MLTIGDVTGIVAFLVGLGLTSWALIVCCGLLFGQKVEMARMALEESPIKSVLRGLGVVALPGLISVILLSQPLPFGKFLGWALLLVVLAVGAIGAAGVSRSAARRIQLMQADLSDYAAFTRGAGFLVTASMLPALGWMLFAPLMLIASLGCGWSAVRPKLRSRVVSDPV